MGWAGHGGRRYKRDRDSLPGQGPRRDGRQASLWVKKGSERKMCVKSQWMPGVRKAGVP